MSPFLNTVREASGLSELFATDCIGRACQKLGLSLGELGPSHMFRLAQALRPTLRLYLGGAGADEAMAALVELADFHAEAPQAASR